MKRCAKHPSKTLIERTIATKTREVGKHLEKYPTAVYQQAEVRTRTPHQTLTRRSTAMKRCAKHPTKMLTERTIATKTRDTGKHLEIVESKNALCCEKCGVVVWDEPPANTPRPAWPYFSVSGTSITPFGLGPAQ